MHYIYININPIILSLITQYYQDNILTYYKYIILY